MGLVDVRFPLSVIKNVASVFPSSASNGEGQDAWCHRRYSFLRGRSQARSNGMTSISYLLLSASFYSCGLTSGGFDKCNAIGQETRTRRLSGARLSRVDSVTCARGVRIPKVRDD